MVMVLIVLVNYHQKSKKTLKTRKMAKIIGLKKLSFLTFNIRLGFIKMGFSHIIFIIKNYWLVYFQKL